MAWDMGNLNDLMGQLSQLFGAMPGGAGTPNLTYQEGGDSGRAYKQRGAERAAIEGQTRGQNLNFLASILPTMMEQFGWKDKLNAQMNAQSEMERRSKLGTPMGRAGMYNNPVQQFGQGLTAVQEGTPNFGSFGEGWGATPASHERQGTMDWAKTWNNFFNPYQGQSYQGKNKKTPSQNAWMGAFGSMFK